MSPILSACLIAVALVALFGVIFEEQIRINKAKTTLFFGTASWIALFIATAGNDNHADIISSLHDNIADIASLWLFLVAAMTFVAYLNKKGMIETLIHLLLPREISLRGLMLLVSVFCFVFSSLADNITATLVSVTLVLSLKLESAVTLRLVALVVFAVNSGGVALITGDVTTLMIFLGGKVAITHLLLLSLPALLAVLLLTAMMSVGVEGRIAVSRRPAQFKRVDILIAVAFLLTITATISGNFLYQIPPVLSFLTGLSIMFLIARFFGEDIEHDPIFDYIRLIEFDTLLFFLGVLLLVGMLKEIGALDSLAGIYRALSPISANFVMGLVSATIDNVPLTAALLKADPVMTLTEWLLLTYAVGVGGSLLVIGSAAGIVAMSKVPGLSFRAYLRFLPQLFAAYCAGFAGVYYLGALLAGKS